MDRWTGSRAAAWPWFVVFLFVLFAAGCQDGSGPNLVTSPEGGPTFEGAKPPPPPPPPPPPADPAIAFTVNERVRDAHGWGGAWFLKVMNADGTNVTAILRAQPGQSLGYGRPAWSPDGRCIAFRITPSYGIYLIDVDVVNGVPTGTNLRLFLPYPASYPAWSPLGDEIAYAVNTVNSTGAELRISPVSGGATDLLYSSPTQINSVTWNYDGTKIGFSEEVVAGTPVARVFDMTTMTVTTAVGPEWEEAYPSMAHAHDAIAFNGTDPVTGLWGLIFTKELPSGTPALVCAGTEPDWSPDDQALVCRDYGNLKKVDLRTGVITTLLSCSGQSHPLYPAWRRF